MDSDSSIKGARPDPPGFSNLVTKHALAILNDRLIDADRCLCEIKSQAERSVTYPDGSLLLEAGGSFEKLEQMIIQNQLMGEGGIWQPHGFASLEPFPDRIYMTWYTTEYRESLGELDLGIWDPKLHTYPSKDYRVEDLQISILFAQAAGERTRTRLAACLCTWFNSVDKEGMFGEGPISKASDELVFRGRLAQFRLDASRSGQDTLNWLFLTVLNFGYEVNIIQDFLFSQEKLLDTMTLGELSKQSIKIQLR